MWQAGRNRTVTGVSLGALTMLVATGCSFNFSAGGPGAVDSEEIATQAAACGPCAGRARSWPGGLRRAPRRAEVRVARLYEMKRPAPQSF